MITKFISGLFILFVSFVNAQNKSVLVSFSINEMNVDGLEFYIVNYENNSVTKLEGKNNIFNVLNVKDNSVYIVKVNNHIVEIPKIDYFSDINYIKVYYYDDIKNNPFVHKYGSDFTKEKGKNYYVDFGLGDVCFVNFSKKKIRKLKKLIPCS
jgi:hypothetical protein